MVYIKSGVYAYGYLDAINHCNGQVCFYANAEGGDGDYDYAWDFDGDGSYDRFDSLSNACHVYGFGTEFNAVVLITDGAGCSDTDTVSGSVAPELIANAGTNESVCEGAGADPAIPPRWYQRGRGLPISVCCERPSVEREWLHRPAHRRKLRIAVASAMELPIPSG